MITFKPEPTFKPFVVSFEINSRKEAVALINSCYTLTNGTEAHSWDSSETATISQLAEISDKMVPGGQWVNLVNSVFK